MRICRIACEREESRFLPVVDVTRIPLPLLMYSNSSSVLSISKLVTPPHQPDHHDRAFAVLARNELLAVVQQVEQLSAVDFEVGDLNGHFLVLPQVLLEYVLRSHQVEPLDSLA